MSLGPGDMSVASAVSNIFKSVSCAKLLTNFNTLSEHCCSYDCVRALLHIL
jgi:hypothetical protein